MNIIEIWSPKYSTQSVLIGKRNVLAGMNRIIFTKAKHLAGGIYQMDGKKIRTYPIVSNGSISCYDVPFDDLECVKQPE